MTVKCCCCRHSNRAAKLEPPSLPGTGTSSPFFSFSLSSRQLSDGPLTTYAGINNPVHFDIFQGRIYITSAQAQSAVSVLDPLLGLGFGQTLTPTTQNVGSTLETIPVTIRNATIVPTSVLPCSTRQPPTARMPMTPKV